MNERIYLIGYMAAGKTTVGRELAALLGYTFFDLDDLIEQATGKTIAMLFDLPDGKEFRAIEKEILQKTFSLTETVIACGGGTPCFFDNGDAMKTRGTVVWVKPGLQTIISRLKAVKHSRPLLAGIADEDLPQTVLQHYREREKCYGSAHIVYNPDEQTMQWLAGCIRMNK